MINVRAETVLVSLQVVVAAISIMCHTYISTYTNTVYTYVCSPLACIAQAYSNQVGLQLLPVVKLTS